VRFMAELPHTPTGKVLKQKLKADETLKSGAMDLAG